MTKVHHLPTIVLAALMLSIDVKAFGVQTLPQVLVSSARRVSPSDSASLSSSSASSSTTFSSSPTLSSSASSLTRKGMLNSEEKISEDYDFRPAYTYTYSVNDLSTGDEKQQEGKGEGVSVQGEHQYSFLEADGNEQLVKYNTDNTNGFKSFVSRKPSTDEYQQSKPSPTIKSVSLNGGSKSRPSSSRQSAAIESQSEQHVSRPEAISLARRFPETVLGHRVQTSLINHAPILFTAKSGRIALTADRDENFKAFRNTGKTIIERFQHPQTIIEQRPATTFITQLTPGRETLSLAHDILD